MDLDTLRNGKFGTLAIAVSDWSDMVKKLEALEKDASQGLKGAADKANWAGVNAKVSREFITKTAGEFADAHTEATTVRNVLKDTHDELTGYQKQLSQAIDDALKKNLTVMDLGDGSFTVTMNIHPDRAGHGVKVPEHTPQDVEDLLDRVQTILKNATTSDNSAASILDELMQQSPVGFSDAAYKDRDSAAKSIADAQKYADLMKKKGDDMSPEEFDQLNRILAEHKNDPLFQEKFAEVLGPRGLLDFWADMSDGSDGGDLQRARHDQLESFQKNLSMTLAGATQSDSPAMQKWEDDMVGLGDKPVRTRGAGVYGFQLMSNLMRVGDYDDQFLDKYGNKLVATEKKMQIPDRYWQGGAGGPMGNGGWRGNWIGNDFGRDPMTGLMDGLSNSPDEATTFFNEKQPNDNAEWVLKDRPVFDDSPLDSHDSNQSREATGRALLAATTGMNPNDPGAHPVEHTAANREVLDRSLKILSDTGDDMPPEFRDDMAKVLINYGSEVHHTASAQNDDPGDPGLLDRHQLLEVTKQVSRNRDAYDILNVGMNHAIVDDIHHNHYADPKESLLRAGSTLGFLEEARYQALDTDKEDPSWNAKFVYNGIGAAANFIPGVGDIVDRGASLITDKWVEDEQQHIDDRNHEDISKTFTVRENQLHGLAQEWEKANPGQKVGDDYTVTNTIDGAAFDGNQRAHRLAGER